jgi:hypothetical protein
MDELRKPRRGEQILCWAPIALGGIVKLVAASPSLPPLDIEAAGTTIALQVLSERRGGIVPDTNIAGSRALLVKLDRDLSWNMNWLRRAFSR